ncbi:hypothetical protein ACFWMG_21685, partial [Streptomyces sp. NPDC127074]
MTDPEAFAQLKRDLAVVVSAEALFTLMDLCGLDPQAAVDSAVGGGGRGRPGGGGLCLPAGPAPQAGAGAGPGAGPETGGPAG